jgi:uncharacterized protein YkwD
MCWPLGWAGAGAPAEEEARAVEARDILAVASDLRRHPKKYAERLRSWLPHFKGTQFIRPGRPILLTKEGAAAVLEAIDVLEATAPLQAHTRSEALEAAAAELVADQQVSGAYGHRGSDGSKPLERMLRHVQIRGLSAENITYGPDTAEEIVLSLVVDDGVPSRGHRDNVLHPRLRHAGVALGKHASGRVMCVIDYAETLLARP